MDSQGNLYLVGSSSSLPFVTNYTHQAVHQGNGDGFIVKINAAGATIWGTYFGGTGYDVILAIAVDTNDNLYVLGTTSSTTGIADANAYQPLNAGGSDAFVAKFTAAGTKLWSTYYGGTENDGGGSYNFFEEGVSPVGIAVDAVGNAYIHTMMQSPGMASVGAFQQNPLQEDQYIAIIAGFSSTGTRLWSTYYGINGSQMGGITANATGLYVAGCTRDCPPSHTNNTYFSTTGSHQTQPGSCRDAFLTKFDFNGQRVWSTYFGGTSPENIRTNHLKSYGSFVYLSGTTFSGSGIATPGAFQETRSLSDNIFLAKFDENGNRLWGTYCGTNSAQNEGSYSNTSIDSQGNVYLCGTTDFSENIATSGAYQPQKASIRDSFAIKFNPEGEKIWGTYYGGSKDDRSAQILVHEDSFYLVGITGSPDNISTPNGMQPTADFSDPIVKHAYIARFDPTPLAVENQQNVPVSIYPNPAKDNFSISLPGNPNLLRLQMYNALGQLV